MFANIYYKKYWSKEGADKQEYVRLATLDTPSLEDAYCHMQAEHWSPNGEARGVIKSLGLSHTSMSVGDIIEDIKEKKLYMVDRFGFKEISEFPTKIEH